MKLNYKKFLLLFLVTTTSCNEKQIKTLPSSEILMSMKSIPETVPIHEVFVGQVFGQKDIPIRARVEGFLEGIYFKEGSNVKKGALLYAIDPDPFREAVVAKAKYGCSSQYNSYVQKESDLKRVKPLAEIDALSKRELDMAQAQRDASISSLEAANADLKIALINLSYTEIASPIDGIIGRTLSSRGRVCWKKS